MEETNPSLTKKKGGDHGGLKLYGFTKMLIYFTVAFTI